MIFRPVLVFHGGECVLADKIDINTNQASRFYRIKLVK